MAAAWENEEWRILHNFTGGILIDTPIFVIRTPGCETAKSRVIACCYRTLVEISQSDAGSSSGEQFDELTTNVNCMGCVADSAKTATYDAASNSERLGVAII